MDAVDRLLIKGAVVVTFCQNKAEVKFQMEIGHNRKNRGNEMFGKSPFYFCLILAVGHNNWSLQGMIIAVYMV